MSKTQVFSLWLEMVLLCSRTPNGIMFNWRVATSENVSILNTFYTDVEIFNLQLKQCKGLEVQTLCKISREVCLCDYFNEEQDMLLSQYLTVINKFSC